MKTDAFNLFYYIQRKKLQEIFIQTLKLLTLILIILVTNVVAKRSFSALTRIKAHL